MLSDVLHLTRPLVVPDTETTGVDPVNDRIVELGFQIYDATGLIKEYRTLVNPCMPIPAETTEVHGYKDDDFLKCRTCGALLTTHASDLIETACETPRRWPTFMELAKSLIVGFTNCDYAGKNVRFDLQILAAEFARAGVEWTIGDARIVDADRLEALLVPRSLSHLYEKYTGRELEDAHGALEDVRGTAIVIEQQMLTSRGKTVQCYAQELPMDLDALHALQWPTMIDLGGKFAFNKDGVACFTRWGKYAGKPMTKADNGYWDWILKNDFTVETKVLAQKAKLGIFPMRSKS